MLENLRILDYRVLYSKGMLLGHKVTGAGNQQGSPLFSIFGNDDPSETTRRAPFYNEEIEAYLQGALHDASLNKRTRFRFTQKGEEWLQVLQHLFQSLGYKAWIYREGKTRDVYALETTASFLDFKYDIGPCSKQAQSSYIRGFFDAEGGIPRNSSAKFYIQLVQKDRDKLQKIQTALGQLEIATGVIHNPSSRVDPNYWRMFVSTSSHRMFMERIGSWHPRKAALLRERMKI